MSGPKIYEDRTVRIIFRNTRYLKLPPSCEYHLRDGESYADAITHALDGCGVQAPLDEFEIFQGADKQKQLKRVNLAAIVNRYSLPIIVSAIPEVRVERNLGEKEKIRCAKPFQKMPAKTQPKWESMTGQQAI